MEDAWEAQREAALAALDRRFANIKSEIAADVIDIFFHHWKSYPFPKKRDKACITMAQICAYRGVQANGDNLKNIWQAICDVRSIRLRGGGIDSALFEIDSAKSPHLNLFGVESPAEADTIFVYSPGFFLAEAIEHNPQYLMPYFQKIWGLHARTQGITKRLARYMRSEWRLNTQAYLRLDGAPVERPNRFSTWAKILDDAGVNIDEWREGKDPSRLIQTVEKAVKELEKMGFVAGVIYDNPSDYKNLPRKGVLAAWLALRVYIAPSVEMRTALLETNRKRVARLEKNAAQKTRVLCGGLRKTLKKKL